MKVVLLSFFVILLSYSYGDQRFCGRILSETLSYMCEQENMVKRAFTHYGFHGYRNGGPKSLLIEGRENNLKSLDQHPETEYFESQELNWPWFGHKQAVSLTSIRGKRQGVADECCLKPCSLDELLSYC